MIEDVDRAIGDVHAAVRSALDRVQADLDAEREAYAELDRAHRHDVERHEEALIARREAALEVLRLAKIALGEERPEEESAELFAFWRALEDLCE